MPDITGGTDKGPGLRALHMLLQVALLDKLPLADRTLPWFLASEKNRMDADGVVNGNEGREELEDSKDEGSWWNGGEGWGKLVETGNEGCGKLVETRVR